MTAPSKRAVLYRMVMPTHVRPYVLKAKALLSRHGYRIEDHWLKTTGRMTVRGA